MVMVKTQVRLPEGLVKQMDVFVESGLYSTRSDVMRDALRRLALKALIGSIPNTGDSVKEVREIRKKLSKEFKTLGILESWDDL